MKEKLVNTMKKWCVAAIVITLAMSLTSCSRRQGQTFLTNYGFAQCDGPQGANFNFDVYTVVSQGNPGMYELWVIPVPNQSVPGDVIRIALANASTAYRLMVSEVVVYPDVPINAGLFSTADIQFYNLVAIRPSEPGTDFLGGSSQISAICQLPLPGSLGNNF